MVPGSGKSLQQNLIAGHRDVGQGLLLHSTSLYPAVFEGRLVTGCVLSRLSDPKPVGNVNVELVGIELGSWRG